MSDEVKIYFGNSTRLSSGSENKQFTSFKQSLGELEQVGKASGLIGSTQHGAHERGPKGHRQATKGFDHSLVVTLSSSLELTGTLAAATAFLKVARPILIKMLDLLKETVVIKHGETTIKFEGVDSADQITEYLSLLKNVSTNATADQEENGQKPNAGGE